MKNALFTTFKVFIFIILFGKVLDWILNFSDETNDILNTAMFTLIGIAFLVMGYIWHNTFLRILITLCGVYLIVMNFFNNALSDLTGIVCLLIPMFIARAYKEENDKVSVTES
jgi:hypothetical protein